MRVVTMACALNFKEYLTIYHSQAVLSRKAPQLFPIFAKGRKEGKGPDNIKATMAEAYEAVQSALPAEHKGMVKNEDQEKP